MNSMAMVLFQSRVIFYRSTDGSTPQSISKVNEDADSTTGAVTNSITSTKNVPPSVGVKILSPASGKEIPVGNLTIFGVSTDNEKSDCTGTCRLE